MLDDPSRVDAHVVGDHVAGEANTCGAGPVAEDFVGGFAAEVFGDAVVSERVGGGDGVGLAAHAFNGLRGDTALPEADEPEAVHAATGEGVKLFLRDLVKAVDVAAVLLRQLLQPDVGALSEEDDGRHPGVILAEGLVLVDRGFLKSPSGGFAQGAAAGFVTPILFKAPVLVPLETEHAPVAWAILHPAHCGRIGHWAVGGLKRIQMAISSSRMRSPARSESGGGLP